MSVSTLPHLQHGSPHPPAATLRPPPRPSCWDRLSIRLDQARLPAPRATLINLQPVHGREDRRPDLFLRQALAPFPPLTQDADRTLSRNAPPEVATASRDRQGLGLGQRTHWGRRQALPLDAAVRLRRRQPCQRGRARTGRIPSGKFRTLLHNRRQRATRLPVPEAEGPQPIEPCAPPVTLRLCRGGKISSLPGDKARLTNIPKRRGVLPPPLKAASVSSCQKSGSPSLCHTAKTGPSTLATGLSALRVCHQARVCASTVWQTKTFAPPAS